MKKLPPRLYIITFLALSFISQFAFADEKTPKLSRATQQLYDNGFKSCSAELDKSVKWVHENDGTYGLHSLWNEKTPDNRMALVTTSEPYSDGAFVTTFFATKDASGRCSVAGTVSMFFDKTCTTTRETTFKDWKFSGDIASTTIYSPPDSDTSLNVYLSPTKNGCLIVKRFTLYY